MTSRDPPAELLTPPVRAAIDAFGEIAVGHPELLAAAPRAFASSLYLADCCVRRTAAVRALVESGALDASSARRFDDVDALREAFLAELASVDAGDEAPSEALEMAALRSVRHRICFAVLWRMIANDAPVESTLAAYSALADAAIGVALERARRRVAQRFDPPRDASGAERALVVVAMGKLGGAELNVSSDIDLIYLHPGGVADEEFFVRVARQLTRLLSVTTADGFVFRVDIRLRPFGESGPTVTSLDSLQRYWIEHARDWERHAMVKARVVVGDEAVRRRFERARRDFVFRRYMDFGAIGSLRELKKMIAGALEPERGDDLKLGRGGIRELEFIVQAFQLVRGGREHRLQSRNLLETLGTLAALELIPDADAAALADAYRFLRRAENALQAMRDAQTHTLPRDDADWWRFVAMVSGRTDRDGAAATGREGTDTDAREATLAVLEGHRRTVAAAFDAMFEGEGIGVPRTGGEPAASVSEPGGATRGEESGESGEAGESNESDGDADGTDGDAPGAAPADEFERVPVGLEHAEVRSLLERPRIARLSGVARSRLEAVLPLALEAVNDSARPDEALTRTLAFFEAAAGRSGYLQVLVDRPRALRRLVRAFAQSAWVARFFARHPILVDEILQPEQDALPDGPAAWHETLRETRDVLLDADLERQMSELRHLRQVFELRVALAWLDGELSIMRVSDQLSWLAEAIVECVLELVAAALAARHGRPACGEGDARRPVAFAVIGYGKLGGLELGHDSDLDLVFLHDSEGERQMTDGAQPVGNGLWHSRLVQKFAHFMKTATEAGVLYDIDLRLRPNGASGLLVTSIDAFATYQRAEAWTWEHQALLRARSIGGDAGLCERFEALRVEILCTERVADALASSVADMRSRMYAARGARRPGQMHLKRDPGGITDLEFVVQYLALAHAAAHPDIVRRSDNVRVIEAALDAGVIGPADAAELADVWLALRTRLYAEALDRHGPSVPVDDGLARIAARVRALRTRFVGPVAGDPDVDPPTQAAT